MPMRAIGPTDAAPAPEVGLEPIAELRAARTAWHEEFGIPVSAEYARFLTAIGEVESCLSTVVEMLREWEPYIEFYAEREMNSPSNNQEAVIEVRDLLRRFRAILRDFPPEPK